MPIKEGSNYSYSKTVHITCNENKMWNLYRTIDPDSVLRSSEVSIIQMSDIISPQVKPYISETDVKISTC